MKPKAGIADSHGAGPAAAAADLPMGADLQVLSVPEDQRQLCRNPAK